MSLPPRRITLRPAQSHKLAANLKILIDSLFGGLSLVFDRGQGHGRCMAPCLVLLILARLPTIAPIYLAPLLGVCANAHIAHVRGHSLAPMLVYCGPNEMTIYMGKKQGGTVHYDMQSTSRTEFMGNDPDNRPRGQLVHIEAYQSAFSIPIGGKRMK